MVREAAHISLNFGAVVVVVGLATAMPPQLGLAEAGSVVEKSDLGQWVWNRDHWVWAQTPDTVLRGTEMRESGIGDMRSAPLHEAGLTVRRTIALAMSAP